MVAGTLIGIRLVRVGVVAAVVLNLFFSGSRGDPSAAPQAAKRADAH